MSFPALNWTRDIEPALWEYAGRVGAAFVLKCLADHANEKGVCFVSASTLKQQTSMARSTVVRHLNFLESIGLIARTGTRGGPGGAIVWQLNVPELYYERRAVASPDDAASSARRKDQLDASGDATSQKNAVTKLHHPASELASFSGELASPGDARSEATKKQDMRQLSKQDFMTQAKNYARNSALASKRAPTEMTLAVKAEFGSWRQAGMLPEDDWKFRSKALHESYLNALDKAAKVAQ